MESQRKGREPWQWVTDYLIKWKGYGLESNSWVKERDLDAEELIDEYLAERVNHTDHAMEDWQPYTDPFTGHKVWYNQELDC